MCAEVRNVRKRGVYRSWRRRSKLGGTLRCPSLWWAYLVGSEVLLLEQPIDDLIELLVDLASQVDLLCEKFPSAFFCSKLISLEQNLIVKSDTRVKRAYYRREQQHRCRSGRTCNSRFAPPPSWSNRCKLDPVCNYVCAWILSPLIFPLSIRKQEIAGSMRRNSTHAVRNDCSVLLPIIHIHQFFHIFRRSSVVNMCFPFRQNHHHKEINRIDQWRTSVSLNHSDVQNLSNIVLHNSNLDLSATALVRIFLFLSEMCTSCMSFSFLRDTSAFYTNERQCIFLLLANTGNGRHCLSKIGTHSSQRLRSRCFFWSLCFQTHPSQ